MSEPTRLPRLEPETARQVWAAAESTGHASNAEPFAPCPPHCEIPADIHRHYRRAPGAYFQLRTPTECCGREWARYDEVLILDQCVWCREDGKPLPGAATLIPVHTVLRDRTGRRR